MFDFVRNNTKLMMGLLFLLIIPSFVMFGIEGYSRFNERGETVAVVNGHKITQQDWDAAHRQQVDRIRATSPNVDAKVLDSAFARYSTLERLVRDRVIEEAMTDLHLTTSDAQLARQLQQDPNIAALRDKEGKLDMERYKQLAASQGMTPQQFETQMRVQMARDQVLQGVVRSGLASSMQADTTLNAFFQQREVAIKRLEPSAYVSQVQSTAEELQQHYQSHSAQFQSTEQADIEYVVLSLDAVLPTITLNEADVKTYYEQNLSRLSGTEQRRASHILLSVAKDAPAADKQAVKAKAQAVLDEARKTPQRFAELAKKHSQDPGSAANGGDLDFFARGAMTPPFENAVFSMQKGQISDLVESDFGYHIIRLTDIKSPPVPSFAQMRPEIEVELKKQMAQRKFAEWAEKFSNEVYEQADSFKSVADNMKLQVVKAQGVTRNAAGNPKAVWNHPKLLETLFSAASIEKKRNTEAVEVAPSTLVSARITRHEPTRTRPFDEVQAQVKTQLQLQKAAELARKQGSQSLVEWQANPAQATVGAPVTVSRRQPQGLPPAVLDAVLSAPSQKLPQVVGVDLGAQGYVVARVNKVLTNVSEAAEQAQGREAFKSAWTQAQALAYFESLKKKYKVEIKAAKPTDPVLGS